MAGAVVIDADGSRFVHRRAFTRPLFPGCWDIVGGSVEAGESVLQALRREIAEETGWSLARCLAQISDETWSENGRCHRELVFVVTVDGDTKTPTLEGGKFVEHRWLKTRADAASVLRENTTLSGSDYIARIVDSSWNRSYDKTNLVR